MRSSNQHESQKYSQYSNTEVQTANRLRLLIMLYDSAIRFIDIAVDRIKDNDIPTKGKYISKALAIVGEFKNTLNFQVGGDLPHQLQRLYLFVEDRLVKANLHNDVKRLEDARRVMEILRSAWVELENKGVGSDPALPKRQAKEGKDNYITINV